MSTFASPFDQLDHFITALTERTRTPGLAIAFFDQEQIIQVSTYGFADLEAKLLVAPQTLFEIGSITKTFVAIAVLQAMERGLLDLHRPVTDYLPWFQVQTHYEPITLHHLLTHSAGLVGIIDQSPDIRGAVWALRETETAWAPGSRFYYSDAGYQVLTLILQEVTGQSLADLVRTHIFEPLDMLASEAAITHAIRPRMAKGYRYLYDDRPHRLSDPLVPTTWIETNSGDCCIVSTAEDMAKFARMLLNGGETPKGRLISTASYALMSQPHCAAGWCDYGYGLTIRTFESFKHIGHGGGMPGYAAEVIVDIENRLGLAVLSNELSLFDHLWKLMSYWRTLALGQPLKPVDVTLPDVYSVTNGTEYVGTYRSHDKTLTVTTENQQLLLQHGDHQIALEQRGPDRFYVNHPDFARFLFQFERTESGGNAAGSVTQILCGPDWYAKDSYDDPGEFGYPEEWKAYPGHYRSHNPWQTNFRVILRQGQLFLVWPSGYEQRLLWLRNAEFCVGEPETPARIRFDQIVNGQALRATRSGCDYYRFFTP